MIIEITYRTLTGQFFLITSVCKFLLYASFNPMNDNVLLTKWFIGILIRRGPMVQNMIDSLVIKKSLGITIGPMLDNSTAYPK
jgi:hypothetical protein